MFKRIKILIAIFILFVFGTILYCGSPLVNLEESNYRIPPGDYEKVLEIYTREDSVFTLDGMENSLTVTATYKAYEFIKAYYFRYVYDFRSTKEQKQKIWADLEKSYRDYNEFYIAVTSSNLKWANLDASDSPWNISLVNDKGLNLQPIKIIPMLRPTPVEKQYFPYTSVYRKVFILLFPKKGTDGAEFIDSKTKYFELKFSGAMGHAGLKWVSNIN